MRAVKSVSIDSERRVIITFLDGSTETLLPELICDDAEVINSLSERIDDLNEDITNLETNKQDVLTFDSAPTAESTNPVTSSGVKTALDSVDSEIGELKEILSDFQKDNYAFVLRQIDATSAGWRLNESNGLCFSDSDYQLVKYKVTAGDKIKVVASDRFQFQTVASVPSSGSSNRVGITYSAGTYFLTVPETAAYLIFSSERTGGTADAYDIIPSVDVLQNEVSQVEQKIIDAGNLNFDILDGINWDFGSIDVSTGRTSSSTTRLASDYIDITQYNSIEFFADSGYKYYAFLINDEKSSVVASVAWSTGIYSIDVTANPTGKYVRIMMQRTDNTVVASDYVHVHATGKNALYDLVSGVNAGIPTMLDNARHIRNNVGTPLTILHISDIHRDSSAFTRINSQIGKIENQIDAKICTGDMVNNVAGTIDSWWDSEFMTCVGNHDTASYSEGSYNWTALSMAKRAEYYIEPFESNWGITHTAGTSYYYKDFSAQKVRLIVMDVMLYNDNGAEASAQTAWLENLLADAITNNLHVLIAIHAPHGGATAKECSFSRYGQTVMPTYTDCNTPQSVIDAVAAKISNGLKFIGYLVGHTHQDNVWDAEGDGKQLMYCITCAAVSNVNQWKASDQHRDEENDAYNIVVVDTTNTLVKLIRGGGANMDDHMRTRRAICINYSNGTVVGEVL